MSLSRGETYGPRVSEYLDALLELAQEHPKCLACHCYRDVAERALALWEGLGSPAPSAVLPSATLPSAASTPGAGRTDGTAGNHLRLAQLLESRDGTHG